MTITLYIIIGIVLMFIGLVMVQIYEPPEDMDAMATVGFLAFFCAAIWPATIMFLIAVSFVYVMFMGAKAVAERIRKGTEK